jgi:RNA polymerase sigma-70 factor, ECF subfamily
VSARDREQSNAYSGLVARGKVAWPEVVIEHETLTRAFEQTPLAGVAATALSSAHHDVYLACACLAGADSARLAFERAIMADVPKAVRRVDRDATFVDDVTADLRVSLLAGDRGRPPELARYAGRGPLRSFVMVLAMRRALDSKRRRREIPVEASALGELLLSPTSPREHGDVALATALRDAFIAAVKRGLASLEPRDRNLLRMHVVDGVSADTLARMYKVHRATMTRWLASARETVFSATRDVVLRDQQVSPETFASFARAAASELDATLSTFLGEAAPRTPSGGDSIAR